MTQNNKRKVSWVTPAFDDFDFPPPATERKVKHSKDAGTSSGSGGKRLPKALGSSALWVDVYAPTGKDDLAVHKKKIQEVESWLVESMAGMKGRRFLLLSGPSGCGKSATIQVLGKEAGLNIVEWINPVSKYESAFLDSDKTWIPGDTVAPVSQSEQFKDFFIRTSKYNSVCKTSRAGNLMLVEDFPNVFLRDPSAFHILLRHYQKVGNSPVVFIVSDSISQQSSVKHLFPLDLQQELSIVNIQFNAIASGILIKAMNRILNMKNMCEGSGRHPAPPRDALESLAESSGGDIRSAVNALQFAIRKDTYQLKELFTSTASTKSSSKSKSKSKSSAIKAKKSGNGEEDSLAAIGGKDASLFLFRALGKILYCKRDHEKGVVDDLPKHLKLQERSPLLENAEDIYDKTAMGAASLTTFLHQNMTSFYPDVDSESRALQHLTDSDILSAEWLGRNVLADYAASVSVRGLMHANKSSTAGGGFRTFTRPQWFTVFKQHQQNLLGLKNEHRMLSVTSEELATVVVPLKAKILAAQRKGNFTKTRELGLFSAQQMKTFGDRLDEHDANVSNVEDEEFLESLHSNLTANGEQNKELPIDGGTCEDAEEEFLIEEYPDD
ncbi:cell cycle checkpoint protein RAD17 [Palaemon carinicauda]|uniref:cell cycle checkpoint protein RAD17 n=1 Tax=Palaemon carinicauda TaxID=392227 RepID=UPI0035B68B48